MFTDPIKASAAEVIGLAKSQRLSIATAESCTVGMLSCALTGTSGAGGSVLGGFVSYDKRFKSRVLLVSKELIDEETAVSRRVAEAMAHGTLQVSDADLAVAITGVAGPEEDEDGNPVGLVYIAVACSNGKKDSVEMNLGHQDPERFREEAVTEALAMMKDALLSWAVSPVSQVGNVGG
jgi:nicotinamide-nucleotide amidase